MPISQTVAFLLNPRGEVLRGEHTRTGGKLTSIDEVIPIAETVDIAAEIDVSALKMLFVSMEAEDNLTVSFEGPDFQLTLAPGTAFVWVSESSVPNPFGSTDVTGLVAINDAATTARLRIEILTDPTP